MSEFIPHTINTRGAVGDVQILASILCEDLKPGTLLDIGSGEGLVAISVVRERTDISVFGIDVDLDRCTLLHKTTLNVQGL